MPGRIHSTTARYIIRIDCICTSISLLSYLILLDDAVLLVRGRRVPWYTNGGAVMTPYCQHCHLLWWCSRCWSREGRKRLDIIWGSREIFKEKCVCDHVKEGFVFRSSTVYIHAASKKTSDVLLQAWQMAAAALHLNFISSWFVCTSGKVLRPKNAAYPTIMNSRLIICLALYATHIKHSRFNLCFSNCTNNTHPPERINEGVGFLLPRKYCWVQ